tara:strand:+ start:15321 stop:16850 length:1530 start_codon:yes stop_codon:yes gene_type:complete
MSKELVNSWFGSAPTSHLFNHNFIDGDFIQYDAGYGFKNKNPATGETICLYPHTRKDEIERAVDCARTAFKSWRKVSRVKRAEYFDKVSKIIEARREQIAKIISLETGKNYNESIAEVNEALHMAQYAFGSGRMPHGEVVASEIDDKDSYMIRKPKGVVAIVSPFNFPVAIGAFWCAAPALVEGNTVILKPSEDAPLSSQICAQIYWEAGFPPGVFNVIHGDGEVGDALVKGDVDHICFTGSAEVGQHIRKVAAESWHKTTSCEMGSKSACIVFDDVEYNLSIPAAIASAFKLSGQRCVSSGRIIVQRTIYDEFAKRFAEAASKLTTGNPFDETEHYYGPLINEQAFSKVRYYNDKVLRDGNVDVLLPPVYTGTSDSYFSTPLVYKTEWRDADEAPYLRNEVFGPHVAIIPFDTIDDAIRIYNDTEYGLAVGVLTNDFRKARIMRDECDAGMIYWNGGSIAAESHLAFGGVKKSGNGFPSAARTFRAVTHEVSWTVNHADSLEFPQGMK